MRSLGLYIHIPFCKAKCIYCDFYSLPRAEGQMDAYVSALTAQLAAWRERAADCTVDTVYFGGGTPSYLGPDRLCRLLDAVFQSYRVAPGAEITLEANPDSAQDISALRQLHDAGFDRLSLGMQSADDAELRRIGRVHTYAQTVRAVENARAAGFDNLSLDLIYGLPEQTMTRWQANLDAALALAPEHLSCYGLKVEEGTPLFARRERFTLPDDDAQADMYLYAVDFLAQHGYEQYEISNFCRPGKYSRHNTSYWKGISYLGCGPSAHSFDGMTREWNVSSIDTYIKGIEEDCRAFETEYLDPTTRYNEFIITTIRTVWGTPIEKLKQMFGNEMWEYCQKMAAPYLKNGKLEEYNGALRLTREGIFISDSIMSDLLWVD